MLLGLSENIGETTLSIFWLIMMNHDVTVIVTMKIGLRGRNKRLWVLLAALVFSGGDGSSQ